MPKQWRSQQINTQENEALLKHSSVAELWWEAFKKLNPNRALKSAESKIHQLDPLNYSLTIPDTTHINEYNSQKAINSLLGRGEKQNLKDHEEVATIYHELFHVYQSNASVRVFDYFYLIDDLQRKRKELLEYLGYANFYILAESTKSDYGKTIFHSVENYKKLGSADSFSFMLEETLSERYKEIDDDIEKFISQYGEMHRDDFLEKAQDAKDSFRETIEQQIEENVILIKKQAGDIKLYSDLSRSHIVSLEKFFKIAKDVGLHQFHLIEGSAQVFGWCCAGYNIEEKFLSRKKDLEKEKIAQNDTYEKAYQLFKESGGKTPLIFILLSTFALSIINPIDTYLFGLKKVDVFEAKLKELINEEKVTTTNFSEIVINLIELIENIYRGDTFTKNMKSIHDKPDSDSFFLNNINKIRKTTPNSNSLEFIIELLLNKNTVLTLIDFFKQQTDVYRQEIRRNEVMRDYEQFLYDFGSDFPIKCCNKHGQVHKDDYNDWINCNNEDSFIKILTNDFKVDLPNKFKGE